MKRVWPHHVHHPFVPPQRDDLSRMYRLFLRVPSGPDQGLEPVAGIFQKHVEEEGLKLVKEVSEAAQARREKDAGTYMVACFVVSCAC